LEFVCLFACAPLDCDALACAEAPRPDERLLAAPFTPAFAPAFASTFAPAFALSEETAAASLAGLWSFD
jgi:hypothetical protein